MTARSVFILSALLLATTLLALPSARAGVPATPAVPAGVQAAPLAGVSSPSSESSCPLSAFLQAPVSSPRQTTTSRCGCGDSACDGKLVGAKCGTFRVCLATGSCASAVEKYCVCITQDPPPPASSAVTPGRGDREAPSVHDKLELSLQNAPGRSHETRFLCRHCPAPSLGQPRGRRLSVQPLLPARP